MENLLWHGLKIRPSMTSSYPDCNLRGLAKGYPDLFRRLGLKLNPLTHSIAAAVGTGTHAGARVMMTAKLAGGDLGDPEQAVAEAVAALRVEAENGYMADDATPNLNTAEQQVIRMVGCYRAHVAPKITPVAVETRVEAAMDDGFFVSGQADVVCLEPGGIDDLKTGAVQRSAMAQLGTYSLVYRPHGHEVEWLRQTFIPRVRLKDPQPAPDEVYYPVALAERVAEMALARIRRDLIALCETGDPLVVEANSMSSLCSSKWCPLHGTPTCRQHRGAS